MFANPAFAQASTANGVIGALSQFVPIILIFAIIYFLLIRPHQKRLKEHRDMVAAIGRGDQVVTAGGLMGKVTNLHDDHLEVEIAQGVKVKVVRSTVSQVLNKTAPAAQA